MHRRVPASVPPLPPDAVLLAARLAIGHLAALRFRGAGLFTDSYDAEDSLRLHLLRLVPVDSSITDLVRPIHELDAIDPEWSTPTRVRRQLQRLGGEVGRLVRDHRRNSIPATSRRRSP